MPENINSSHVISLDRYSNYATDCAAGAAKSEIKVKGFFTVAEDEGLKANEYSNMLLYNCDKIKVSLDDVLAVSKGSIKPIHYLVPVTDSEVLKADDIMNFTINSDGTGHLFDYPELQFIYAHYISFKVDGSISRQGGKIEIIL